MIEAIQLRNKFGHKYVNTGHLLIALLDQFDGSAVRALRTTGLDVRAVMAGVIAIDKKRANAARKSRISGLLGRTVRHANELAGSLGGAATTTGHLLLALLDEPDSIAGLTLSASGILVDQLREITVGVLSDEEKSGRHYEGPEPAHEITVSEQLLVGHSPTAVWALVEPIENALLRSAARVVRFERLASESGGHELRKFVYLINGAEESVVIEVLESIPERRLVETQTDPPHPFVVRTQIDLEPRDEGCLLTVSYLLHVQQPTPSIMFSHESFFGAQLRNLLHKISDLLDNGWPNASSIGAG